MDLPKHLEHLTAAQHDAMSRQWQRWFMLHAYLYVDTRLGQSMAAQTFGRDHDFLSTARDLDERWASLPLTDQWELVYDLHTRLADMSIAAPLPTTVPRG